MRVYVHDSNGKRVIEAEEAAVLAEVIGVEEGAAVWLEDADEPLGIDEHVAVLAQRDIAAVHVGKGQITVTVSYNGLTTSETFGPGTKVDKVLDWATSPDGFNVPVGDRVDLVLRLTGSTDPLDPDAHIGTLAEGHPLALDLLPGERFAG